MHHFLDKTFYRENHRPYWVALLCFSAIVLVIWLSFQLSYLSSYETTISYLSSEQGEGCTPKLADFQEVVSVDELFRSYVNPEYNEYLYVFDYDFSNRGLPEDFKGVNLSLKNYTLNSAFGLHFFEWIGEPNSWTNDIFWKRGYLQYLEYGPPNGESKFAELLNIFTEYWTKTYGVQYTIDNPPLRSAQLFQKKGSQVVFSLAYNDSRSAWCSWDDSVNISRLFTTGADNIDRLVVTGGCTVYRRLTADILKNGTTPERCVFGLGYDIWVNNVGFHTWTFMYFGVLNWFYFEWHKTQSANPNASFEEFFENMQFQVPITPSRSRYGDLYNCTRTQTYTKQEIASMIGSYMVYFNMFIVLIFLLAERVWKVQTKETIIDEMVNEKVQRKVTGNSMSQGDGKS